MEFAYSVRVNLFHFTCEEEAVTLFGLCAVSAAQPPAILRILRRRFDGLFAIRDRKIVVALFVIRAFQPVMNGAIVWCPAMGGNERFDRGVVLSRLEICLRCVDRSKQNCRDQSHMKHSESSFLKKARAASRDARPRGRETRRVRSGSRIRRRVVQGA